METPRIVVFGAKCFNLDAKNCVYVIIPRGTKTIETHTVYKIKYIYCSVFNINIEIFLYLLEILLKLIYLKIFQCSVFDFEFFFAIFKFSCFKLKITKKIDSCNSVQCAVCTALFSLNIMSISIYPVLFNIMQSR